MKKNLAVIISVILIIAVIGVVVFAVVTAMNKQNETDSIAATNDSAQATNPVIETLYSEHYKVGIIQTGLGSASKDCYGGFMMELDERSVLGNLEVVYIVEDNEDLCRNKIQELVDGGDIDLLYTIGRFASETAAEITKDIPIVFGAVNSPDEVGLVESNEVPGGNVTGVSSYTPCFEQIDLIKTILPNAKSVAALYSATDQDAVLQGIIAAREAENIGLKCAQYTIEDKAALETALKKVKDEKDDVIYVPVDKFLSSNFATIIDFSYENKIPVICGDEATLTQGALGTSVINYESIGRKAAGMAEDILFNKKDVATLSVMYKHDCTNMVNKAARDKLGVEIPATALGEIELWEAPTELPTEAPAPTQAPAAETEGQAEE
ncbi:MAG: ABC transporter substrate-binding protein [Ruminococcus sp.]|nr:ABC transporter substrate-binding protein [Ruminococcus sp.]